jgi:hypothetical protein
MNLWTKSIIGRQWQMQQGSVKEAGFRPRLVLVRKSLSACQFVCSIETMPRATAENQARGSKSRIRKEARRLLLEER